MLTYHYDNVMYGRAAAPGAMVAQNSDYTQKPYREGDDVSASESFFIDIPREQALLREHEVIVFQHPLYTYSCPALLKEWLDRVLSRGFASGPGGNQLAGKYWRSVITTGEPESAYRYDALNRYPMSDVLRPFELAAGMCRMHWLSPIIIYWARRQSAQELASHARAYGDWLANPLSPGGR